MKFNETLKLLGIVIICQFAGFIGAVFTTPAIGTWYAGLKKPFFTPPDWIFGPVWISLYLLMGVAAYLALKRGLGNEKVRKAMGIFSFQLILNVFWSVAFFGFKSPFMGLVVILILWIAILRTIVSFYRISAMAGVLMVPYILWVSIATVLNFYILWLNP